MPALADELSGAFTLSIIQKNGTDTTQLTLQLRPGVQQMAAGLAKAFQKTLVNSSDLHPFSVDFCVDVPERWGGLLDYERKFFYLK